MSNRSTAPNRIVLYAATAVVVLAFVALQRSGQVQTWQQALEARGLSRMLINVLFGIGLGALLGVILRTAALVGRAFSRESASRDPDRAADVPPRRFGMKRPDEVD